MIRKSVLLVFTSVIVLILSGCFTELPVNQYSIKQAAVTKASTAAETTKLKGKPESRVETPASSRTDTPTNQRMEELEKSNRALREKLDLFEQRITELEKKLKSAE
jgi:predicted RNase H-like nuclease (RuvC/YqgF family)